METEALKRRKKAKRYAVFHESEFAAEALGDLPDEDTVCKCVSFCRVSALGFIRFVAERTVIDELTVSTFRVGPKAMKELRRLHERGRIGKARFVVGKIMGDDHRKTSAIMNYEALLKLCARNGWEVVSRNNHTKLALFDTADGMFVLEGSSNLNEAPNWEQFSLERDEELYDFYAGVVDAMFEQGVPRETAATEDDEEEGEPIWQGRDSPLRW